MINIVLFGPPGSGKGTQAQNLIQKFNLKQISTGDLFRHNIKNETELGKLAKSYMDKGELVPDQVTIDMLIDELNDQIDICLSLVVEDEILVKRLLERGKTSGRSDDADENIIRNRIKEYYTKTAEVAELYKKQGKYVEVNGVGEIAEIAEKLYAEVEKIK